MLEVKFVTDLCVFEVNIDILNVYNLGALVPPRCCEAVDDLGDHHILPEDLKT